MPWTKRIVAVLLVVLTATSPAVAQDNCGPDAFARLIDETGAYLRNVSKRDEPRLRQRFNALARKNGWAAGEAEDRGYEKIRDKTIDDYDARGRKLLLELDELGATTAQDASCDRLERLETVTRELRRITAAKTRHIEARLEKLLGDEANTATAPAPPTAPLTTAPKTRPSAPTDNKRAPATTSPRAAGTPQNSATRKSEPGWQTSTSAAPEPSQIPSRPLHQALPQPQAMPPAQTYSSKDIARAGHGLFGSISASLASVIRYAFDTYGEPNAYILGTEGGGAVLAGINYGKGELHMKGHPPVTVYWQGPSVGYDFGLTGSRVMFLVYNLKEPDDIFARFGGVGGSAYVVGGVGLTYHMRGSVVLAPIRTGLGLRIGANIGYLKFTPERSLNPF